MNNIKSSFSIKDLENLSGIKAHTIRIWEKRYNLLEPERTDTNIRLYDLESLQKLLNISYLNHNGYKISKIASLESSSLPQLVKEVAAKDHTNTHTLSRFKMAMLNFDQTLFYNTYDDLTTVKSFREIFYEDFLPLLSHIGLLWQTDTITPAHEHFISTLIRQKITVNIEASRSESNPVSKTTYVLFLPDNEIHELGLMYLNYEIVAHGHRSIFLGQSVPVPSLMDVLSFHDHIIFVSYFTVKPEKDELLDYINDFTAKLLTSNHAKLYILGQMLNHIDETKLPKKVTSFSSIENLVKKL